MQIIFILCLLLLLVIAAQFIKQSRLMGIINALGHSAVFIISLSLVWRLVRTQEPVRLFDFFYIDSLSGFFIFTVALVTFSAALYSISYIGEEVSEGVTSIKKSQGYYSLFNLFCFTMFCVPAINNLAIVWVAIEMTTLVSAFLVGFHSSKTSIEAAWKYIIICSVGIALALLGIILLYHSVSSQGNIKSLNWTDILSVAHKLDPKILKIAFVFILVGFGTKAGIAPMHTWLPDAHSQSPSPISALLSGVLLKTAIFAVLRFMIIINRAIGAEYTGHLFIFFGILSLGISAGFILIQKDLKRLLAYSSLEHIGVICLGIGFGGYALYGMLLHISNHAVTKSLMFFGAGRITRVYRTNNISFIRGAITTVPFTAGLLILGAFALTGTPPFSIFISEMVILSGGFMSGKYVIVGLAFLFIALVFAGIVNHFSRIVFGKKPQGLSVVGESLSTRISLLFLFGFILLFGIWIPPVFQKFLFLSAGIIKGN